MRNHGNIFRKIAELLVCQKYITLKENVESAGYSGAARRRVSISNDDTLVEHKVIVK